MRSHGRRGYLGYAEPGEILASPEMECAGRGLVRAASASRAAAEMEQPDGLERYTVVGLSSQGSAVAAAWATPLESIRGARAGAGHPGRPPGTGEGGAGADSRELSGSPVGVGKSRLGAMRSSRAHSGPRLADPRRPVRMRTGQATPYLPVIELPQILLPDRQPPMLRRRASDKVAGTLRTLGPARLASSLPAVLTLLDVPVEDAAWARPFPIPRNAAGSSWTSRCIPPSPVQSQQFGTCGDAKQLLSLHHEMAKANERPADPRWKTMEAIALCSAGSNDQARASLRPALRVRRPTSLLERCWVEASSQVPGSIPAGIGRL